MIRLPRGKILSCMRKMKVFNAEEGHHITLALATTARICVHTTSPPDRCPSHWPVAHLCSTDVCVCVCGKSAIQHVRSWLHTALWCNHGNAKEIQHCLAWGLFVSLHSDNMEQGERAPMANSTNVHRNVGKTRTPQKVGVPNQPVVA